MLVLGVGIVITAAPQQKPSSPATAETLMGAALHQEEVEGNLEAAIATYKKVIADARASRSLKATALLHLGRSYEKLGDAEALKACERVVREFGDQVDSMSAARTRLAALQSPRLPPAGPVSRHVWTGDGANLYASVTPDGRYMSFMGFGVDDLGVRDLLTGTIRRLTNIGGRGVVGEYSSISRDGRQVAYVWYTPKPQPGIGGQGDLRILPLAGGDSAQPRIVYRSTETPYLEVFDWTPDGTHLLVDLEPLDRTWKIAFISSGDGSVRVLKSLVERPTKLSLSPDGRFIAYDMPAADRESARDIFVLAADGSQETVVVEHRANDRIPVWSADGSQLLFVSDRSGKDALWRVPIDGGRPKGSAVLVREELGGIVPLGTTRSDVLYYVVNAQPRSDVYVAALDAAMKVTSAPSFATHRFVGSNGSPAWSHDGQYLAYRARRGVGAGADTVLVIRALRTGEERDIPLSLSLSVDPGGGAGLKWFPDGRSVLVVARERKPGQARHLVFYRVDVTSGKAEPLLSTKADWAYYRFNDPELSADGRTIFYIEAEDRNPSRQLVRFDLDSRRETILKRGRFVSWAVAVSPDGAEVAYVVMNPSSSRMEIEIMPAAGGEPRQVSLGTSRSGDDPLGALAWTPDQGSLLFVRVGARPFSLWRVAATGGEPENVGISGLLTPRVHPDGRRIAYEVPDNLPPSVWTLEDFLPKTGAVR
jgi:Tol biopolymer transport system component